MLRRCISRRVAVASGTTHCPQVANAKRDPKFKRITPSDVAVFVGICAGNKQQVLTSSDANHEVYMKDWFGHYHAQQSKESVALLPTSTEQVADIVRYCQEQSIAVVPQGGNTSFVGGSVPVFDEVVISLSRMNKVLDLDTTSQVMHCQAGCVLERLDVDVLNPKGMMMPVDLGAKGSCHIGGNVSTNAGGIRYMRYGNMHGNTLGLKVVTPSPTSGITQQETQLHPHILDLTNMSRKDSCGYDLKHLYIGSEGTLGIVTEVNIQLAPYPRSVQTMFLECESWPRVIETFLFAKQQLGEILSAVEFIDGHTVVMCNGINKTESPLASSQGCKEGDTEKFYLLLETHSSDAESSSQRVDNFLTSALDKSFIGNGVVAQSTTQSRHIWQMRESPAIAPNKLGHVRWYDISITSPEKMYDLVAETKQYIQDTPSIRDKALVTAFGHLGDGNLHINIISKDEYDATVFELCDRFIYEWARAGRYSISAEHGIGMQKKPYLHYVKGQQPVAMMKQLKEMLDPKGIMNPYKLF